VLARRQATNNSGLELKMAQLQQQTATALSHVKNYISTMNVSDIYCSRRV
jgi:hypothetical protein